MKVWTDYRITAFGDKADREAPLREAEILSYDGGYYCLVRVRSDKCEGVVVDLEINVGYLYENQLKRQVSKNFLHFVNRTDGDNDSLGEAKADWSSLWSHAHYFLRGQGIGDEICSPVALVFEESPPTDVMLEDWSDIADQEAQRLFDLLRKTMPQGILDRLGALIMRDRASDFIISKTDLDRRDGRG